MTVTIVRSGIAATLLGLLVLIGGLAAPAGAADVSARQGSAPAQTPAPHTTTPRTADRDSGQLLVVGGAVALIGAGLAGGAWRARRDPEGAAAGH
ncbi:MAG TPA: hypothetical protein VNS55_12550 [Nocardioides sp.]|nr:hypothetical protein [Nocardioides sp.]